MTHPLATAAHAFLEAAQEERRSWNCGESCDVMVDALKELEREFEKVGIDRQMLHRLLSAL